jgi:ribonuclease Z
VSGKTITLPDGRLVHPDQVLGEERPGTRMAHVGDVGRTDELVQFVHDVDALIIEATYMHEEAEMAEQFAHLTARQAAELAASAGVKYLILTHVSRRYRERDILGEAQAIFPNTFVARDFDAFQVRRGECVKVEQIKPTDETKQ